MILFIFSCYLTNQITIHPETYYRNMVPRASIIATDLCWKIAWFLQEVSVGKLHDFHNLLMLFMLAHCMIFTRSSCWQITWFLKGWCNELHFFFSKKFMLAISHDFHNLLMLAIWMTFTSSWCWWFAWLLQAVYVGDLHDFLTSSLW